MISRYGPLCGKVATRWGPSLQCSIQNILEHLESTAELPAPCFPYASREQSNFHSV